MKDVVGETPVQLTPYESLSGSDAAATLRRIEEHLAAILQQQERRSRTWLTIQEVAQELQVSRDSIDRLIASGKLKAAPIATSESNGRRKMHRIKTAWVEEFLDSLVFNRPSGRSTRSRRVPSEGGVDFIG